MNKYNIFCNGVKQAEIKTNDIYEYMKSDYPNVNYEIDDKEREVYIEVDIITAMKLSRRKR